MADTLRISYSGTNIDFSPQAGYSKPDEMEREDSIAADGTLRTVIFYHKRAWSIPVRFMNLVNSDNINSWWQNGYAVSFYPDMVNDPGTSYSCRIMNKTRPLPNQPLGYWETYFEGTINLREI